ncbi:MAG: SxtJ family membrane protein [Candidatus Omnitrophota bacterium]
MDKEKKDLLVFGYGLAVIAVFFAAGGALKHGFGLAQQVLVVCALVFAGVTLLDWQALRPGYKGWMKVAHVIGGVVTTAILTVVFVVLFVPIGLFLRLVGKDHLERGLDRSAASYWHRRPEGAFDRESYRQQF